ISEITITAISNAVDTAWVLISAVMVFHMQAGFAMLEVGSVSIKNTKNILIKNIGDSTLGAICWWLLGYGLAFGRDTGNGFAGSSGFAIKGEDDFGTQSGEFKSLAYANWLFHWAFAATAATIVSGAIAERATFTSYLIFTICITSFIYPVVVHWVWAEGGWANSESSDPLFGCGTMDFAGCGVVHMTGGLAALVAMVVVGPRSGRFNQDGTANNMPSQSTVMQTLGTLILWFGWFGFNAGSVQSLVQNYPIIAKVMVMTAISAAGGALSSSVLFKVHLGWWDSKATNNGILVGLVGITSSCATVEPEAAFVIGAIGGLVYFMSSNLLVSLRVGV
ncbi:unnamed protein product, partial [Discosporangium mesarthrocarpum]